MINEFVSIEQAKKLKELGFKESCLTSWNLFKDEIVYHGYPSNSYNENILLMPIKQQVFRWYRESYGLEGFIDKIGNSYLYKIRSLRNEELENTHFIYLTYEEAVNECLNKLIDFSLKAQPK